MPTNSDVLPLFILALRPERLAALLVGHVLHSVHGDHGGSQTWQRHGHVTDAVILGHLLASVPEDQKSSNCSAGNDRANRASQTAFIKSFLARHSATWVAVTLRRLIEGPAAARHTPGLWGCHATSPYAPLASTLGQTVAEQLDHLLEELAIRGHMLAQEEPNLVLGLSARGIEWRVSSSTTCGVFEPCWPVPCARPSLWRGGPCTAHQTCDWLSASRRGVSSGLSHLSTTRQSHLFAFYSEFSNLSSACTWQEQDFSHLFAGQGQKTVPPHERRHGARASEQAAQRLGYPSVAAVAELGLQHLKHRFRARAREAHPDCGGTADDFHVIETDYRTLLAELSTPSGAT